MENSSLFAKNIRFLRKAAGLTAFGHTLSQAEFADGLNVTRRTVILWESGQMPNGPNLFRLSEYFTGKLGEEISVDDLVNEDLTGRVEYFPVDNFQNRLSPSQRRILKKLLLRTETLTDARLEEIERVIDTIMSRDED